MQEQQRTSRRPSAVEIANNRKKVVEKHYIDYSFLRRYF
jgi:hypothetical protein